MIMSSTSQLSDNVPVCRRGITSKQFGYLGELVSSAKSYRISRKFRRSALRVNTDSCSANGDVHRRSGTFAPINNYQESVGPNIWPSVVNLVSLRIS